MCTVEGDLLLIHLLEVEEDEKGAAGGAVKGDKAAKTRRAPVAFFRAPSPIQALDCQGAEIALGCQSGAVLLLRAAVLLTLAFALVSGVQVDGGFGGLRKGAGVIVYRYPTVKGPHNRPT